MSEPALDMNFIPTLSEMSELLGDLANDQSMTLANLCLFGGIFATLHPQEIAHPTSEIFRLFGTLHMPDDAIQLLFHWCTQQNMRIAEEVEKTFRLHGPDLRLSATTFIPAYRFCIHDDCDQRDRPLTEARYTAWYYSRMGPEAVYWVKRTCSGCKSQYYPNFRAHDRERFYDLPSSGAMTPSVVHVTERIFVEATLAAEWRLTTAHGHVSRQASATIYNTLHRNKAAALPAGWISKRDAGATLRADTIGQAFYLSALLRHCWDLGQPLIVMHTGRDDSRFLSAIRLRNALYSLEGSPYQDHACKECCRLRIVLLDSDLVECSNFEGDHDPKWEGHSAPWMGCWLQDAHGVAFDGAHITKEVASSMGLTRMAVWLRCMVVDGTEVTRTRCAYTHQNGVPCLLPPINQHYKFCMEHREEVDICIVPECRRRNERPKFETCTEKSHREREEKNQAQAEDMRRVRQKWVNQEPLNELDCKDKTNERKKKGDVRLQSDRTRTKCEFLFVNPCRNIARRTTYMNSESVPTIKMDCQRAFPDQQRTPSLFVFDNNCTFAGHLIAAKDNSPLRSMIKNVDRFHFATKHKKTDQFCQANCNPYSNRFLFPSVDREGNVEGKPLFNTSVCEQINSWFGKFQAIVREMETDHYEFFLDEMILARNEAEEATLEARGMFPTTMAFQN